MQEKNKTVLITSNYAWTIFNFRMPLIKRLRSEGYHVIVLTQFDGYEGYIAQEVNQIRNLLISRKGLNPFLDSLTILDFVKTLIICKPDILMPFTIKPLIYSSIAAKLTNVRSIVMITGLGTAFASDSWLKKLVITLYRFALSSVPIVIFQNDDDKNIFLKERIVNENVCRMSPGSGVDLDKFSYTDVPEGKSINFLFIGRVIWDKGVKEFVDAARNIRLNYPNAHFQILGPLGVENRTSVSNLKVEEWQEEGVIEYLGETDNVLKYLKKASCIVLPSYREGTSRVLLEAAAVGRPIIASNVPGCREIVDDGVNGYLCDSKDYVSLSKKIELMLNLPYDLRKEMGIKGREKVELKFNQDIVCDIYVNAIKECEAY